MPLKRSARCRATRGRGDKWRCESRGVFWTTNRRLELLCVVCGAATSKRKRQPRQAARRRRRRKRRPAGSGGTSPPVKAPHQQWSRRWREKVHAKAQRHFCVRFLLLVNPRADFASTNARVFST